MKEFHRLFFGGGCNALWRHRFANYANNLESANLALYIAANYIHIIYPEEHIVPMEKIFVCKKRFNI